MVRAPRAEWSLPSAEATNEEARNRHQRMSAAGVGGHAFANLPFLIAQLGRQVFTEVVSLGDLADLDLRLTGRRIRAALDPLDGFLERFALKHPIACDEIRRFRKRALDHGACVANEPDADAFRARSQPVCI